MHEQTGTPGAAETVVGALLAGGRSTRMGQDKAGLTLADGRFLAQAAIAALDACCDRVVTLGHSRGVEGLTQIPDPVPGLGPMGAIAPLVVTLPAAAWLICPCDLPEVDGELLQRLLEPRPRSAAIFETARGPQPLPIALGPEAPPHIAAYVAEGGRSVKGLLPLLAPRVIRLDEADAAKLRNVNRPSDLPPTPR